MSSSARRHFGGGRWAALTGGAVSTRSIACTPTTVPPPAHTERHVLTLMPTSPAALDVSFSLDEEFSRAPPTMTGEPDKPPREEQPIPFFPTPVAIVPNARVADGR